MTAMEVVTALIADRPLCVPCLTEKAGLSHAVVETTLKTIGRVVDVHDGQDLRCQLCGRAGNVFFLGRSVR